MGKGRHQTTTDNGQLTPPDGGWGWAVVLGSFMLHIIADGIVYSFGVFYIEFLDEFKAGKGDTAWIGSLVPGVCLLVGPVASALTNRYGCRKVTVVGALVASLGFILSLFAPNIYYLYVTFGILSGLGFGLMYLPAIVSVSHYFDTKRSFATGLAVCGSGIGTFIFAPLSKFLVDEYKWQGAALIEAGIILNCILCGALFRPLTYSMSANDEENGGLQCSEKEVLLDKKIQNGNAGDHVPVIKVSEERKPIKDHVLDQLRLTETNNVNMFRSEGAIHKVNGNYSEPSSPLSAIVVPSFNRQHSFTPVQRVTGSNVFNRKDIFYSGSLMNIPQYKSNPEMYITSIQSIPEIISDDKEWFLLRCLNLSPEMKDAIHQMLDFSLLKDVIFVLFVVSNICTSIGFNMPYIYLPACAQEAGIDENSSAFLVSVIGITNTIGRIVFGWLADRPWVNRLMLYNTALVICGVATALSPLNNSLSYLQGYAAVFGAFIGVYVGLTSVVLVDLLGIDKLTNAFGLLLMFQGVATLIGPPIAGWLYDATGSYDISFYVAGTVVAFSGAVLYIIPVIQKCTGRKSYSRNTEFIVNNSDTLDNEMKEVEMSELKQT